MSGTLRKTLLRQYRDARRWSGGKRFPGAPSASAALRQLPHRVSRLLGGGGGVRWSDERYERAGRGSPGSPMPSALES